MEHTPEKKKNKCLVEAAGWLAWEGMSGCGDGCQCDGAVHTNIRYTLIFVLQLLLMEYLLIRKYE